MKGYAFDKQGVFVSEFDLQLDPLESKRREKKIYLVPANTATVPPPKTGKDEVAVWLGSTWKVVKIEKEKSKKEERLENEAKLKELAEKAARIEKARERLKASAEIKIESLEQAEAIIKDLIEAIS